MAMPTILLGRLTTGCAAALLVAACGSQEGSNDTVAGTGGAAGAMPGGAAGNDPGTGGSVGGGPGSGGSIAAGGAVGGGGLNGMAGSTPGGGGTPGAGGDLNAGGSPGAGGDLNAGGNPGAGGAGGGSGVQLVDCQQDGESAANPVLDACGTFDGAGPLATKVQLGPYGGQMDVNVGKGFENPDPMDSAACAGFVAIFGEDPTLSAQLQDVGPQPCNATAPNVDDCLDMKLYSVFKPAIWPETPVPVITWGNGTCAQPEGYGTLLRYVASHGFFVVAANSREVGTGAALRNGLDFAAAANEDPSSPYYGHLDMTKVGAMGHSQGSGATASAASDPRIQSVILWNGGASASKPFLAVSGDLDIGGYTAASMASAINQAPKAAFLYYHNPQGMGGLRGHLPLMLTPQRVVEPALAWWQMTLQNDAAARDMFVGADCGLCNQASDFEFGQNGL